MKFPRGQTEDPKDRRLREQQKIVAGARKAMAQRDEALDGETRSRLRRARSAALEEAANAGSAAGRWLPVGVAGVAATVVVALLVGRGEVPQSAEVALLADAWLLEEDAELEMIEDVEFYQWLAEEALDGHSS
ncbi:hypothetical protein HXX02_08270 [Microbulbifer elongatus]|uniref:DUF3619 family protein n=1 Tax=Microbulbifer elongatus TaxID=86173 RepID=A0ABT1P005_9GAMM|nr:hypothetical protein [Microbulbifer elongatus]MCQ3829440.1 hypothetical protein [Microbulbifer elongatus]